MSDYYGLATLESWLEEEIYLQPIPKRVLILFEPYREELEYNIESWFDTDHGDGCVSWRGWGRGYNAFPEELIDSLLEKGRTLL